MTSSLDAVRDSFADEAVRRWTGAAREVKRALLMSDALGLGDKAPVVAAPSAGKAEMFRQWLSERLALHVAGYDGSWLRPHVEAAAAHGALRVAMGDAQQELDFLVPGSLRRRRKRKPRSWDERRSWRVDDAYDPDEPRDESGRWMVGSFVEVRHPGNPKRRLLVQITTPPDDAGVGSGRRVDKAGDPVVTETATHVQHHQVVFHKRDVTRHMRMNNRYGELEPITDALTLYDAAPSTEACFWASAGSLADICEGVLAKAHVSVANGLMTRARPVQIAQAVEQALGLGLARTKMLAEHAVTQAYSQATLDGLEARGVTHVGTLSERRQRASLRDFDPNEPRDEQGRWTTGGSVSPSMVHMGGAAFVSPSVEAGLTFAGAHGALSGPRQAAMLKVSGEIDQALGLKASDKPIIGAWSDGAENSVLTKLPTASWDELRLSAAMKGHVGDQKAVLAFQHAGEGDALLYQFTLKGGLADIHEQLLKNGIAFHSLAPTADGAEVYVADLDGSAHEAIKRAAENLNADVTYHRGRAAFIGSTFEHGTDREVRDDARRAYQGLIDQSPVQGGAEVWRRNRDRWSQALASASGDRPGAGEAGGSGGSAGVRAAQEAAAEVAQGHAPLRGLPQNPLEIDGQLYVPGPIGRIRDAADAYMAGKPYQPPTQYVKLDRDRAKRLADAYDAMPNAPDDPAVKASYAALARETMAQWQAVKASGLKVEWIKPGQADPYASSPRLAAMDVAKNNHWWGFPTDLGYGSGDATSRANNPMLADSGEVIGGRKTVINDVFRIVHDYFGHFKDGNGFRAEGEDNAWRSHAAMFSAEALPAMTAETRGQNSWVNFGPYGESNRKASAGATHYAPQKIGIMPDWAFDDIGKGRSVIDMLMDAARKTPQAKHPRTGQFAKAHVVARELRRHKKTGRFQKQGPQEGVQARAERAETAFRRAPQEVDTLTAGDDRVCDVCDGISANGPYTINKARSLIPAHPNAVLEGSTFASYGAVDEMVSAAFAGPAIYIGTLTKNTTIGPYHPMLTRRGMVKARDLREGDELLYDLRADRNAPAVRGGSHLKQMPLVEDGFRALASDSGSAFVAAASHDFHGDAIFCQGEIEVVHPARQLLPVFDSLGVEQLRELDLAFADAELHRVAGFSSGELALKPVDHAASGGVRWPDVDGPFVWLRVLNVHEVPFVGAAFDASTASSLYCSDGFVVSNCRCLFVAAGSTALDYDPDEPRDERGRWTEGGAAQLEKPPTGSGAEADAERAMLAVPETYTIATPERLALRQDVAERLYGKDLERRVRSRQATIILGLPAAGKSALAGPLVKAGALEVDPDLAKEMLPEYNGGVGAYALHEESSGITRKVLARAVANGDNFVWPRIDSPDKIVADMKSLKRAGYDVHLKFIDISPSDAIAGALKRFHETGRYVSPKTVLGYGDSPRAAYRQALATGLAASHEMFRRDSSGLSKMADAAEPEGSEEFARRWRERLDRSEALDTEALRAAVELVYGDDPDAVADYDPNEPRDPQGRWTASEVRSLTKLGLMEGPAKFAKGDRNVTEVADDLVERSQAALRALGVKGGKIKESSPAHDALLAQAIAEETKHALTQSGNAADWYRAQVETAMRLAAVRHPEIATDQNKRAAFKAALAITSQGETVDRNVVLADAAYEAFAKNGKFPEDEIASKQGPAMLANFKKFNGLLKELGPDGATEFLARKMTVRQLTDPPEKGGAGYRISGLPKDAEVNGSAIFGPKIGAGFYQNLSGNYDPVTQDLWFMRTWGRLAGTLRDTLKTEEGRQATYDKLRAELKAAGMAVPKTTQGLNNLARKLFEEHEANYRKYRAEYDSGQRDKAKTVYAAERVVNLLEGIREDPGSGAERAWRAKVVNQARSLLADQGIKISNADLQATIWYPEKTLWERLGSKGGLGGNTDYAQAYERLLRAKGTDDAAIQSAIRRP